MKKLLALMFLLPSLSFAQSVMGIDFGSSYETTKSVLEKRFGSYNVHENDGSLELTDFKMGDFQFDFGSFHFQYSAGMSFLSEANFQLYSNKNNAEAMKRNRDYLYSLLRDKYADEYLEQFTNEQGFRCYKFGENPKDKDKVLGVIALRRGKGRDGIERLYLTLDYGPIFYIDKASDF